MAAPLMELRTRWTRQKFDRRAKEFLPHLYRAARSLAGQSADCEDLVHDTYVKAVEAFRKADLRSADDCRAWLYRILVNTYRDQYRRRIRNPVVSLATNGDDGRINIVELVASPEPGPMALLERSDLAAAVRAAIQALSPEVRIVATLFFAEGLSYAEIAAATECPIGTVMSRLSRGRQQLRLALRDLRLEAGAADPASAAGARAGSQAAGTAPRGDPT